MLCSVVLHAAASDLTLRAGAWQLPPLARRLQAWSAGTLFSPAWQGLGSSPSLGSLPSAAAYMRHAGSLWDAMLQAGRVMNQGLSVAASVSQVWNAWEVVAPVRPQLYLYSSADALIPPAEVELFMKQQVGGQSVVCDLCH